MWVLTLGCTRSLFQWAVDPYVNRTWPSAYSIPTISHGASGWFRSRSRCQPPIEIFQAKHRFRLGVATFQWQSFTRAEGCLLLLLVKEVGCRIFTRLRYENAVYSLSIQRIIWMFHQPFILGFNQGVIYGGIADLLISEEVPVEGVFRLYFQSP